MPTLGPTHSCFDDAMELLGHEAQRRGREYLERVLLVHGLCQWDDRLHAHAWVLQPNGDVTQAAMLDGERVYYDVGHAEFMAKWRPVECTVYTAWRASCENYRTGHYGPWVERYRRYCRGG